MAWSMVIGNTERKQRKRDGRAALHNLSKTAGGRSRARRVRLQRRRRMPQAGRLFNSKGDRGRDARATMERKTGQRGSERNVPFYETNPFGFRGLSGVSVLLTETYAVCSVVCKWVRFPKRTHLGAVFEGCSLKIGSVCSRR